MRKENQDSELTTLKRQRAMLLEALGNLVEGLDATTWSSWQTTAHFWDELEKARAAIAAVEGEK